jgi:hypothetical protein
VGCDGGDVGPASLEAFVGSVRPIPEPVTPAIATTPSCGWAVVSVVFGSAFAFALVGAVSETKGQFMVLVAVCIGTAMLRSVVLPSLRGYGRAVSRVPIVVRGVAFAFGTYELTQELAGHAVDQGSNATGALVMTIAIATPISALILPSVKPEVPS